MSDLAENSFIAKIRELNRKRVSKRRHRKAIKKGWETSSKRRTAYTAPGDAKKTISKPLVSIIIVGYNGARHLVELVSSIQRQTYPHYEIIYVDNASTDNSADLFAKLSPSATIIRNPQNSGFAEGNNIGVDHAKGDFLLLLNNDAKLSERALESMVSYMLRDEAIGAVTPKILFWEPFVQCTLTSSEDLSKCDVRITESTTGYHKVIERASPSKYKRLVLVPASSRRLSVVRSDAPSEVSCTLMVGGVKFHSGEVVPAGKQEWILNNVGSWVSPQGGAGDWGLGEADQGQYEQAARIDAFCGCCALVRPAALGLHPLFAPKLFAYYEDTDASLRIAANQFKVVYAPEALVYHKHASTSGEDSPFSQYVIQRNKSAFQAAHFPTVYQHAMPARLQAWREMPLAKQSLAALLGPNPFATSRPFIEDALSISAEALNGSLYERNWPRPRIGIYNEFWSSKGGGELRALHFAKSLLRKGDVYLISRKPLDVTDLCGHFGVDPAGLRCAVMPQFGERDTAGLDLLVNTTYTSSLYSRAKKSVYLVSFPHWGGDATAMDHYDVLLANSRFTQRWCNNIWPGAATELLYPAADEKVTERCQKEKIILSIGRFFQSGHNKKQLEMLEAFARLSDNAHDNSWRLVLIGGCNTDNSSDRDYLAAVKRRAAGLNAEILVGASAEVVQSLLKRSAIYWHATGVGLEDEEPEKFEHFGMAIVEAMSHGLVPVVHERGGPPEIVEDGQSGFLFRDVDQLVTKTRVLMSGFDSGSGSGLSVMSEAARRRAQDFSLAEHDRQIDALIQKYGLL